MYQRLIFRLAVLGVVLTSAAHAADPSLIGWWKLDEGAGTVTTDSSGNGHDGSLVSGPVWTAGVSGRALQFDGIDDYVLCAERGETAPGTYPAALMPA